MSTSSAREAAASSRTEFKVLSYGLTEGWEVISAEFDGDHLTVIVKEVIASTTTTVKPESMPVPPVIVDRFVVEVPGNGSFVIGRVAPLGGGHRLESFSADRP